MNSTSATGSFVVMAKRPGESAKTRLSPILRPADRKALAQAFLRDKSAQLNAIGRPYAIAVAPPDEPECMRELVGEHAELFAQVGADLGERLLAAMSLKFAAGPPWVGLMDADTPTLPNGYLHEACTAFENGAELVVGPAWDGGYYFIGCAHGTKFEQFFGDMPWSTCEVFAITLQRAQAANLKLHILPAWYDVDTPHDLARLADELRYATAAMPGYPRATAEQVRAFLARGIL